MAEIRIGISGWTYPPWRKVFYPEGLPQRRELEYASRAVTSIEINGTFYGLQKPASYRKWATETPDDFAFSVKGNRFITHIRRLREVETPLANFFASGPLELGEKLGPFLWQLPPTFQYDPKLLENFFGLLPQTGEEALELAHQHSDTIKEEDFSEGRSIKCLRHALEVRHKSFENEEFVALLKKFHVALVVADTAGKWPFMEDLTSDFVYARLHGDKKLYVSGYSEEALDRWARKVDRWAKGGSPRDARLQTPAPEPRKSGRDVYVYFDNDVKVHAPFDAMSLAKRLGAQSPHEFDFAEERSSKKRSKE
jgi:uncharacterized protein YecE (DUF72 family)